jgi:hypothetical protein
MRRVRFKNEEERKWRVANEPLVYHSQTIFYVAMEWKGPKNGVDYLRLSMDQFGIKTFTSIDARDVVEVNDLLDEYKKKLENEMVKV